MLGMYELYDVVEMFAKFSCGLLALVASVSIVVYLIKLFHK